MHRAAGLLGLLMMSAALPAYAEGGGSQASEASEAKDVVRLKNGGLLRGTISELNPGQSVTIVTAAGKTRELPMSDVGYAGPAARDPGADAKPGSESEYGYLTGDASKTEPAVTVIGQRADLRLTGETAGITFHRQAGSAVAIG